MVLGKKTIMSGKIMSSGGKASEHDVKTRDTCTRGSHNLAKTNNFVKSLRTVRYPLYFAREYSKLMSTDKSNWCFNSFDFGPQKSGEQGWLLITSDCYKWAWQTCWVEQAISNFDRATTHQVDSEQELWQTVETAVTCQREQTGNEPSKGLKQVKIIA